MYLFKRLAKQKPIVTVNQGATWFRAQTLCDGCSEYDGRRMGAPPFKKASSGRAAPAGIRVLYMANRIENAIFVMRPKPNKRIQVASFVINKNLGFIFETAKRRAMNNAVAVALMFAAMQR